MKKLLTLVLAFSFVSINASESGVVLNSKGLLKLGDKLTLSWWHNPAWRQISLSDGKILLEGEKTILSGECHFSQDFGAKVSYTLKKENADNWIYTAAMFGIGNTKNIGGVIKIPADIPADIEIDNKLIRLSGEKQTATIVKKSQIKKHNTFRISSGTESYCFSGEFSVSVRDLRFSTKENYYCIDFSVPRSSKEKCFNMQIKINRENLSTTPIPITAAANMDFTDQFPNDGKGGWTDQGLENDLSCMNSFGLHDFAGINFDIINPQKNKGKSCLVLSDIRPYPPVGKIELRNREHGRYIYLLHACAWPPQTGSPVGHVIIKFLDGKTEKISVIAGKDCGNWWQPVFSFENGIIGWIGDNKSSKVGLYVSAFPISDKPIESICFQSGKSVWMIVGATLSNMRLQGIPDNNFIIEQGKQWQPVEVPLTFQKGSAMDFSHMNRFYPAKDGALKIDENGHFVLEKDPSIRVRFYGTNLAQSITIPTHQETDILVDRLAMDGFNSIRIHQFENFIYDWTQNCTLDFQPEKLDRFFYLIAKLRERGMYITTDVHSTRIIRPGDGIIECSNSNSGKIRKALTMFSDTAMQNWKDYATKILTTKNPYSGLCLAEDPALFAINMDNEAHVYHTWQESPELFPLIEEVYSNYLKQKNLYSEDQAKKREDLFYEFLKERQYKIQREQIRFLKNDLKVKAYICNLNNVSRLSLQPFRYDLDMTDVHIYHDHPSFPLNNWNVPIAINQKSAIASGNKSILKNMRVRIPGKPNIVTELQFCYPNRFRSEIATLAGAYAALQGWDALYRFAASHSNDVILQKTSKGLGIFNHYYDPIGILTGRIIHFLFVRGDVSTASGDTITYGWKYPGYKDEFDSKFHNLGLYTKIGSAPKSANINGAKIVGDEWEKELPESVHKALENYESTGKIFSSTNELMFDRKKISMSVITPKSEVFSFPGGNIGGKFLNIHNSFDFSTISVHSFDGKSLQKSHDILLYHLTNAIRSGTVFQNETMRLVLDMGHLPVLAYRGCADIILKVDPTVQKWNVQAIALDGSVLGIIKSTLKDNKLFFNINVFGAAGTCMVYRITAENLNL
ncbi:MAG: hypothetical protein JXR78_08855 [Victivallales bacterium]|nr:hypothetical protein [Victivallales bacterium]